MPRTKKTAPAHPEASNGAATAVAEPQAAPPASRFEQIPIEYIFESGTNPRRTFDKQALGELAESIRTHGILQPVLCRPRGEYFELVAGARRFRAAKTAGLDQVPAIVQDLDEKQALEVQYLENLQRQDLHPLEEANGYAQLHEGHGYSIDQLAGKLGKSRSYVYGRLTLAKLPKGAQKLFLDGQIDASTALLVARIPVPELAEQAAKEITEGDYEGPLSYRRAVELVRRDFQCHLKGAPFPVNDATLVPAAGACAACPKRTGNQKDLFGPVAGEDRADVCTDPKCFADKRDAQYQRAKVEVLAQGGTVLKAKRGESAFGYTGNYVPPNDKPYDFGGTKSWKQLCKGREPKPVLGMDRDGAAEIRWPLKEATAAARLNGHTGRKAPKSAITDPSDARRRASQKRRQAAFAAVMPEFLRLAADARPSDILRLVIEIGLCTPNAAAQVSKRRGNVIDLKSKWTAKRGSRWPDVTAKAVAEMPLPELQALALELLAGEAPAGRLFQEGYGTDFLSVCEFLGIDMKAAEKAAAKAPPPAKTKAPKKVTLSDVDKAALERMQKRKPTAAEILSERKRSKQAKGKAAAAGDEEPDVAKCRVCGCTEEKACAGGCSWVPDPEGGDLCSACAEDLED